MEFDNNHPSLTPPPTLRDESSVRLDDCKHVSVMRGEYITVFGADRVSIQGCIDVTILGSNEVKVYGIAELEITGSLIAKWGDGNAFLNAPP